MNAPSPAARLSPATRAECRSRLPPLSFQRPAARPLLAGRRCRQHSGPQPLCPAARVRTAAKVLPANGRMPPPANMAICSISSRATAIWIACATCSTKPARFLSLPQPDPSQSAHPIDHRRRKARRNPRGACSRCRSPCRHARGSVSAQTRHHASGRVAVRCGFIRAVYYRADADAETETWPALIAAVTDLARPHHRRPSHLARPVRPGKAPIATPRRAMGHLLGNAVRFGSRSMSLSRPAKASRPCCRSRAHCRILPMAAGALRQPSRRDRCSRRHCACSTSCAMPIPPGDGAAATLTSARGAKASRRCTLSPLLGRLQRRSAHPRAR